MSGLEIVGLMLVVCGLTCLCWFPVLLARAPVKCDRCKRLYGCDEDACPWCGAERRVRRDACGTAGFTTEGAEAQRS